MFAPLVLTALFALCPSPSAPQDRPELGSEAARPAPGELRGRVVDVASGTGVPRVEVNVYAWRSDDPADRGAEAIVERAQLETDGEGRFRAPAGFPTGPVTVSLYDPTTERALGQRHGEHPARGSETDAGAWTFEVDLGPTVPFEIVTAPDALRPAEWRVRIVATDAEGREHPWPWRAVQPGPPTWARWPFVDRTEGELRIEAQGRGLTRVGSAPLPRATGTLTTPVRIPTELRASLEGRVVTSGAAPARPWVTGFASDGSAHHARAGADGRFVFQGLPPGPFHLTAHAAFGAARPTTVVLEAGAEHASELRLDAADDVGTLLVELPDDFPTPAVLALEAPDDGTGAAPRTLAAITVGVPPAPHGGMASFADVPTLGPSESLSPGGYSLRAWTADGRVWSATVAEVPANARLAPEPDAAKSAIATLLAPGEGLGRRLHLRDGRGCWNPRDLAAYALSLERSPPVAGVRVALPDGTELTSDADGRVELPEGYAGPLRIASDDWRVFPSPGFADGRVRWRGADIVVWLRPR